MKQHQFLSNLVCYDWTVFYTCFHIKEKQNHGFDLISISRLSDVMCWSVILFIVGSYCKTKKNQKHTANVLLFILGAIA